MNNSISYCLLACNDLPWLRVTIPHAMRWADEICIMDMGSTDGTKEFCKSFLRPEDKYLCLANVVPQMGFAECVNAACGMATKDWVFRGDPDMLVDQDSGGMLKWLFPSAIRSGFECGSVSVENYMFQSPATSERMEWSIANVPMEIRVEPHVLLYRREAGFKWQGYIHEELHSGEVNCYANAAKLNVTIKHFSGWINRDERRQNAYWMLQRAIDKPELQKYTNAWWFKEFYPANEALVRAGAAEHEARIKNNQLTT